MGEMASGPVVWCSVLSSCSDVLLLSSVHDIVVGRCSLAADLMTRSRGCESGPQARPSRTRIICTGRTVAWPHHPQSIGQEARECEQGDDKGREG